MAWMMICSAAKQKKTKLFHLLPIFSPSFLQMRAEFDQEKKRAVNVATRSLERDLERLKADHATEIEEILENHKQECSESKKKQWVISTQMKAHFPFKNT